MTDEQTLDEQASDLQGDEPGTENVTVTTDEERIAQLEDQLAGGPRKCIACRCGNAKYSSSC